MAQPHQEERYAGTVTVYKFKPLNVEKKPAAKSLLPDTRPSDQIVPQLGRPKHTLKLFSRASSQDP